MEKKESFYTVGGNVNWCSHYEEQYGGSATHSSILAWKIYGWRSLVGYRPWGCKELDTAELLHYLSKKLK